MSIKKFSFRSLFSGVLPPFMLAHFAHHLLTALPTPLLPMIRSNFALNYTQSGFVISAFSLSYGISQLPAGWLADHIGRRVMITVGILGVALAGLLVGLSHTYTMMIVFLVLMGLLGGGYHPSSPPIISASVEPNRGRALGLHLIGGSASYFLAPIIAAAVAVALGWRGPFIILAVPTIVFGILFYVLLGRWTRTGKTERKIISNSGQTSAAPLHWRRLAVFIFLSTFTGAVITSTTSFLPLFLVDHFGVAEAMATASMAIVYSGGLWVSPLGGYLSDRVGRVPTVLAVCLITGPIIFLLNLAPYGLGSGAVLVLLGIAIYARMPASEAYIVGQTSERNRSTILGIYYFSMNEGGGVLTPVMGYLIDHLGFYSSFTIASVSVVIVALVCSIWLRGSRD